MARKIDAPITKFRLRRRSHRNPLRPSAWLFRYRDYGHELFASSAFEANARVDQGIGRVDHEVRQRHRQDDDQNAALNQWVVQALDGVVDAIAHAGIGEDHLGDEGAADDMAQRDGQPRRLRQQRVAKA